MEAIRNIRPVTTASVGNWQQHLARISGQLQIHGPITQELIDLGYENNDKWLGLLDGVVPDTTPGKWPEFIPSEDIQKTQNSNELRLRMYLEKRGLSDQ